jgi:hypothetical protein
MSITPFGWLSVAIFNLNHFIILVRSLCRRLRRHGRCSGWRQQRETPREYLDRESHYVWGRRYLLQVAEGDAAPMVELRHSKMLLTIRPGTDEDKR